MGLPTGRRPRPERVNWKEKSGFIFKTFDGSEEHVPFCDSCRPRRWQVGGCCKRVIHMTDKLEEVIEEKRKEQKAMVEVGGTCMAAGGWELTRTLGRRGWGETQSYRVMGGESHFEATHFKVSSYLLNISCHAMPVLGMASTKAASTLSLFW